MKKWEYTKNLLSIILSVSLVFTSFMWGDSVALAINKILFKNLYVSESEDSSTSVISQNGNEQTSEVAVNDDKKTETESVIANVNATPKDIEEIKKEAKKLFKNYKKSGSIDETVLGKTTNTIGYKNVLVNNKSTQKISVKDFLNKKPSYKKIEKNKPYILIYHTHTTEGYELLDLGWYSNSFNSRTRDASKSVVRVGDEIEKELTKQGFKVIHDKTIYDNRYTGAYSKSRAGIEKILKENPSIMITLDIHRDAIHYNSGTRCKPTTKVNGKKAAQVMIISGCEGGDVTGFKSWRKNLSFALDIQNTVSKKYKDLMRPVMFCHRKYNMDITPCSLLLEFGTDANTLEEAVYSGSLVGRALGEMLNKELE